MFGDFQLAPETSTYQGLKLALAEIIPIDRDILHVVLGAVILGLCLVVVRSGRRRAVLIAFGIACGLGLMMELLDARDDVRSFGAWRWQASLLDMLRTIAVPSLALLTIRLIAPRPG